jgi:cobalt/nickel transport protein
MSRPKAVDPRMTNLVLVAAVIAVFAVPLALRLNTGGQPAGEAYAGTDSTAAAAVSQVDPHYEPWFSPVFEPSSGEVESGLFALQAALGAGAFGFVLGRLSGRRRAVAGPAVAAGQTDPAAAHVGVGAAPGADGRTRPVGGA